MPLLSAGLEAARMVLEGSDSEGRWLALVVDATAARVSVATVESRAHRVQSGGSFVVLAKGTKL